VDNEWNKLSNAVQVNLGFLVSTNYVQNLWEVIDPNGESAGVLNGIVEAAANTCGIAGAVCPSIIPKGWSRAALPVLTISLAIAMVLMAASPALGTLPVAFTMYALQVGFTGALMTMASARIAESMVTKDYGAIVSLLMLVTLILNTIVTTIISSSQITWSITGRFIGFAIFYSITGCTFGVDYLLGKIGC